MKHKTLLIIVAIFALATLSCGLGGLTGQDSGGDQSTAPADSGSTLSEAVNLETLDSYRLHMVWKVQNEDGSEGATMTTVEEWVKGPPLARHFAMSMAEAGQEPMPFVEAIVIGDSAWAKFGDTWMQMSTSEALGMAEAWTGLIENVSGWTPTGEETVNGVHCQRYTSGEKQAVGFADPQEGGGTVKMNIQGEAWLADEPDLPPVIIRERTQIEGGFFPFAIPGASAPATGESGRFFLEYDLADINTPIAIHPPDEFSEMPAGLPAAETPGLEPPVGEPAARPTKELPAPPAQPQTKARPADGMMMVYIPLGEFLMGDDASAFAPEKPAHLVFLNGFWMDQNEVTNVQYRLCVEAGACVAPPAWESPDLNGDQQPVLVPWSSAQTYCQWVGGRLPTEAEWEKAARGTDGRLWPWGNTFEEGRANLSGDADGYGFTAPVGTFPGGASPYGLLDMAGNAAEWVADWCAADYYAQSPAQNPTGPAGGEQKVLRSSLANGGGGPEKCRTVARYPAPPEHERWHYGFRCVFTTQP